MRNLEPQEIAALDRQLKAAREQAQADAAPDACRRNPRAWGPGDRWCERCWRGIAPDHECDRARITGRIKLTGTKTYQLERS